MGEGTSNHTTRTNSCPQDVQSVQDANELGINLKPEVKPPLQLEPPIRRIIEVDPQGVAIERPVNPTGGFNSTLTREQIDLAAMHAF